MARHSLLSALGAYARIRGTSLAPGWEADVPVDGLGDGTEALETVRAALGWEAPDRVSGRPQPDQFPLLVHDPARGWLTARQLIGEEEIAIVGSTQTLRWDEGQSYFALSIPDPLETSEESAFAVFKNAVLRRWRVLAIAGFATVFANLLTLATSLYAMQLYDRVIPLASFETLYVLTAGVLFALTLDFALRSLRAWLIELEAQNIDKEVSQFFFARAQAIRLDARPKGIGTMAAQIQGQEQIRQVMSSSTLFVFADLPFAALFILVVWGIGGSVALVPVISLPIAIAMAFVFASIIRKGTERAQVTGNQKNGLLVEMLDATETIKANRGGWQIIAQWNKLVRQIHHYEVPVKRASAISSSIFSTLQQMSYVAVMGYGAYLAATGKITTGGLLACSIIVGRINGPLIAQLPNLIVQWGYARSSLKALDNLLKHPTERTFASAALRPSSVSGPLTLSGTRFAYGEGAAAVDLPMLEIKPGEKVAIVGGVGAGKSTLLKLLAGLYSPQSGSVALGGYDLSQLAEDVVRQRIGYLSQSSRLVRGPLREALTMGLADIPDERLIETARATGLDALFGEGQMGLDFVVQEGGLGLSGGQRALVGLNRLLHQNPQVWLLDEPTSALDINSEKKVLDAIDAAQNETNILIMATHKIALLERFTRVIVMRAGTVINDQPVKQFLDMMRGGGPKPATSGGPPTSPPAGGVTTRITPASGTKGGEPK